MGEKAASCALRGLTLLERLRAASRAERVGTYQAQEPRAAPRVSLENIQRPRVATPPAMTHALPGLTLMPGPQVAPLAKQANMRRAPVLQAAPCATQEDSVQMLALRNARRVPLGNIQRPRAATLPAMVHVLPGLTLLPGPRPAPRVTWASTLQAPKQENAPHAPQGSLPRTPGHRTARNASLGDTPQPRDPPIPAGTPVPLGLTLMQELRAALRATLASSLQ